jgi:DNA-binding PadR family transcriptional regulator
MKSIKETSIELEVTPATIYNHMKKLEKELVGYTFKKKGVTYLEEEALRLIKISMGLIQAPVVIEDTSLEQVMDKIYTNVNEGMSELQGKQKEQFEELKSMILELQEQLDQQNKATLSKKIKGLFKTGK